MSDENTVALELIEAHFNKIEIGQFEEFDQVITEEMVSEYVLEHGINWPDNYIGTENELLAPPGIVFFRPAVGFGLKEPNPPLTRAGFFTRTDRTFHQPVRVGESIRFRGEITDKYLRRGYYYIVVDWTATGANGALSANGREWHTLGWARHPQG